MVFDFTDWMAGMVLVLWIGWQEWFWFYGLAGMVMILQIDWQEWCLVLWIGRNGYVFTD